MHRLISNHRDTNFCTKRNKFFVHRLSGKYQASRYLRRTFYCGMQMSIKIFSGTGSQYLAEKIAQKFGATLGKITISRFSDGEIQPVFQESIRGDMVFLVQSTFAPAENILELLLMIDAARRASAYKVVA